MTNENTELELVIHKWFKGIIYDTLEKECREFFLEIKKLPTVGNVSFSKPLDAIAYELYGDENLYYVLAVYNDIIDPLDINNTYIKYPRKEDTLALIVKYTKG